MDETEAIRQRAAVARRHWLSHGVPPYGRAFLDAVASEVGATIILTDHDSTLLQGARAKLVVMGEVGTFLYVDVGLRKTTQLFCIAHELGHLLLHVGSQHCDSTDIAEEPSDDAPSVLPEIAVYHPRERQERDANLFATEFLASREEIRDAYLADPSVETLALAERFGIDTRSLHLQLVAALRPAPLPGPAAPFASPPPTQLDPSQLAAATAGPGPTLIDAGPGTGKTRTLVARALWLIEQRVAPGNLLLLTFSNRATGEMRERLIETLGERGSATTVSTFHALAHDLLKRYAAQAYLPTTFQLVDDADTRLLLRRHLGELPLAHYLRLGNPDWFLKDLQRAISRAKDELVSPEGYAALAEQMRERAGNDDRQLVAAAQAAEVAAVYATYQQLLERAGLLDFGDLLFRAVRLLQSQPDVVRELRARYAEILVDEYQDTNRASGLLLRALAGDGRGLWVVGDPRQSIYRFRGASPENMLSFADDFPGTRRLRLERNYRSVAPLVALFGKVATILPGNDGQPISWEPTRFADGDAFAWAVAPSAAAEQEGVATTVRRYAATGVPYRSQAVLCRSHGQLETVGATLEAGDIPVRYLGNLFARHEVKDLLAVLSACCEPLGYGLLRLGSLPDHPVGRGSLVSLIKRAQAANTFVRDLLDDPGARHGAAEPEAAHELARLSTALHGLAALPVWECFTRYLFDRTAAGRRLFAIAGARGDATRAAVAALIQLACRFAARPGLHAQDDPQRAFLDYVRFLVEQDDMTPSMTDTTGDGVALLTAHASKGLEFDAVCIPALARGRWPSHHGGDPCPDPPGLSSSMVVRDQDEANLFFVALTRARRFLTVSRAERYGLQNSAPSELWEQLLTPGAEALAGAPLRWPAVPAPTEPVVPPQADHYPAMFSAWELEDYLHCPRRYYYVRLLGLPPRPDELGGMALHVCVRLAAGRLQQLHADGALPASREDIALLLDAVWTDRGPVGHPYEAIYRRQALDMLDRCRTDLARTSPRRLHDRDADVALGHARVQLHIDHAEIGDDGTVRLIRFKTGKPSAEHTREHRVALYHLVGEQRFDAAGVPYRVAIRYLGSGEEQEVERNQRGAKGTPGKPRFERQYEELRAAAAGTAARQFDPKPGQQCLTCTFNLVCPA